MTGKEAGEEFTKVNFMIKTFDVLGQMVMQVEGLCCQRLKYEIVR